MLTLMLALGCAGLNAQQTTPAKKNKTLFARTFARTKSQPTNLEKRLYHASIITLWSSAAFDYTETYFNMTHPENVCSAGTGLPTTTFPVCGTRPATNVEHLGNTFVEGGWARFMGGRDYPGVAGMNIALDTSIAFTSRWLYRQGGVWRWAGIALNFWHGAIHIQAGSSNVRYDRWFNKNIGLYVPPGFQGPIWWGIK